MFHGLFAAANNCIRESYPGLDALGAVVRLGDRPDCGLGSNAAWRHGRNHVLPRSDDGRTTGSRGELARITGRRPARAGSESRATCSRPCSGDAAAASRHFGPHKSGAASRPAFEDAHESLVACLNSPIAMDLPLARQLPPHGRLDRLFGNRLAETIRSATRPRYIARGIPAESGPIR